MYIAHSQIRKTLSRYYQILWPIFKKESTPGKMYRGKCADVLRFMTTLLYPTNLIANMSFANVIPFIAGTRKGQGTVTSNQLKYNEVFYNKNVANRTCNSHQL